MNDIVLVPMDEKEARECLRRINSHLGSLRTLVLDLYERQGWVALGYSSWRECVAQEFEYKQAHLYRLLVAAQVEREISPIGETGVIPESQLRPLTQLEPDEQMAVWQVVKETAPAGKVTAAHVKSVVNVFKEAMVTGAIDNGDGISIPIKGALYAAISDETAERVKRQAVAIAEKLERRAELQAYRDAIPLPTDKYRVIYADPPWQYGNTMPDYFTEQADHYSLMTMEQICQMPVRTMCEENAVLFLWVTSPILEESFEVVRAWGFQYKASFVWDKIKHNMGHYNSVRHEILLVCTRGSCQPDVQKLFDSVVSEERTEHSKKPESFRQIIDTIYPHGKRIELFARASVENWDCYGNEIPR